MDHVTNSLPEEGSAPPPAERSHPRDVLGGFALVGVSVLFGIASFQTPWKNESWEWYTSPGIFALAMAVCLGGCSLAVGCRGLRGFLTDRGHGPRPDWRGGLRAWGMGRFLAAVALIGAYLVLLGRVPFLLASAGLILVFGTLFREDGVRGGLRPAIVAAGVISLFSYGIMTIFGVVFP